MYVDAQHMWPPKLIGCLMHALMAKPVQKGSESVGLTELHAWHHYYPVVHSTSTEGKVVSL